MPGTFQNRQLSVYREGKCIQYKSSVATEEAMSGFYVYSRNREQVFGEFGTDTMAALDTM